MGGDRTWAEIIYSYNCDQRVSYVYKNKIGPNPEANLHCCPKCSKVFERRYEQKYKQTVVYLYSQLCKIIIPEHRYEFCESKSCSGEMYEFYF